MGRIFTIKALAGLLGLGLLAGLWLGAQAAGAPMRFELGASKVRPSDPLFDGPRRTTLHWGFRAEGPTDVVIRVIDRSNGNTVRVWRARDLEPGRQKRRWDGLNRRGGVARDGGYAFFIGQAGGKGRGRRAAVFVMHSNLFPVDGSHYDRGPLGQFGAPRNGGRIHEGYDIMAVCGTPLVAVRGGVVTHAGYDDRLYGYNLRINPRKSGHSYFYSHLIGPSKFKQGERIRTGDRLGRVGQTGNARSTPCHLHFELRDRGRLKDPKPKLMRWNGWS